MAGERTMGIAVGQVKKEIKFTNAAWTFYNAQTDGVRREFDKRILALSENGRLELPDGKSIAPNLFEIRIKVNPNQYRLFYCYVDPNEIWILSGYQKKTRKTPLQEINRAKKIQREVSK